MRCDLRVIVTYGSEYTLSTSKLTKLTRTTTYIATGYHCPIQHNFAALTQWCDGSAILFIFLNFLLFIFFLPQQNTFCETVSARKARVRIISYVCGIKTRFNADKLLSRFGWVRKGRCKSRGWNKIGQYCGYIYDKREKIEVLHYSLRRSGL